jgi:predicted permease
VIVSNVTSGFFPILGVAPLVGRTFSDAENNDPQSPVVILSADFGSGIDGDPGVVGRTIQLNARPQTIVGVMPPGFQLLIKRGSQSGKPPEMWTPMVIAADARDFGGRYLEAIARLKPGVTVAQAQAGMALVAAQLEKEDGEWERARVALIPLHEDLVGNVRQMLQVLSLAVALVLCIACANVMSLLLARGAARQREIAIRSALGAARGRVVRQLLTESFVLALLGGAVGLLVAQWGLDVLLALSPVELTVTGRVTLSYPVLAFTAVVSLVTAVVCGSRRRSRIAHRRAGNVERWRASGRRHRSSSPDAAAFVVAEMALAVVLLVGAGLMLRSFSTLRRVDPGYATTNILTMRLQLPNAKYGDDAQRIRFFQEATSRIAELPGVQSVGAISYLPLTGLGAGTNFTIEGQPPTQPGQDKATSVSVCDNGFLKTLNVPLVRGRFHRSRDARKSNVVLVSESFVRSYFPNEDRSANA